MVMAASARSCDKEDSARQLRRDERRVVITEQFLEDYDGRTLPWARPTGSPSALDTDRVLFGNGDNALEVAIAYATSASQPRADDLRALFRKRHANRPAPVLLVVGYKAADGQSAAAVVGTAGDPAPIRGLSLDRVARVCTAALSEPDRHSAARTIDRLLGGLKDQLTPGLVNSGLFASHELRAGVPSRADWPEARQAATPLLSLRGLQLMHTLGFATAPRGSVALLLTQDGTSRALGVLLDETEVFDRPSDRFGVMSPVAHGLTLAAQEGLPWLVVLRGSQIRLYPSRPDVGVGRKGQAETYTELDLALLGEDEAAYLTLLFGPSALAPGGTVDQILAASENFAADLGKRLRERIYGDVVPGLALAVAARMQPQSDADLTETYHRTLLILFRLLFLAYAEDRGLLPYGRNPRYDRHAVKTLAKDFAGDANVRFDEQATSLWDDMVSVWAAVDEGNSGWDVPAYNGGLFSRDATTNPSGAALAELRLTDAEFGPVLRALLVDAGEDGTRGPVDFRSLTVREFGTIYEGLLESNLSIALADLTVDSAGSYLPATPPAEPVVRAGEVYIHNQSGQRRSTGSYFTKQFAVEHLLDTALEPAIDAHLEKVADLLLRDDDAAAAELFFDLRVGDLAMGSAHFLVAAIDRIAAKFTAFLAVHAIPAVSDELTRLAHAASTALGQQAAYIELDPVALLRRQIARRCIYGLDLNLMAVELGRLAIWIHTFVPGLPMSALDHNLVVGNSLTGIGTLDEVLDVLEPQRQPGQFSLFTEQIESALVSAKERLTRAARTAEATKAEVREAARAHAKALDDAADAKALLDAAIGVRLGIVALPSGADTAIAAGRRPVVLEKIAELQAAHLPYLFPEVFLRANPGFDVLLGNPPWDEVTVEEHKYWQRYYPGVVGLRPAARTARIKQLRAERPDLVAGLAVEQTRINDVRSVLISGPYPGLGTGDVDYYKAFSWRVWNALRHSGNIGMVFPRSLLNAAGSAKWREQTLTTGQIVSAVTLANTGRWVFPEVDPRYTVVLIGVAKTRAIGDALIRIAGPFHSLSDFHAGIGRQGYLPATSLTSWGNGAAFPLLPDTRSTEIFTKYRQHPRFDAPTGPWEFRSVAEFHATNDRSTFDAGGPQTGRWPVYTGATFNLWDPDAGDPTTWCDPTTVVNALQKKRRRQARTASSAFSGVTAAIVDDPGTLPCMRPRIAYRQIARPTDSRTVLTALVPGHVILTNAAPYLLRRRGSTDDEAYLLGVLSSIPLDWYARRFVELNVNIHILTGFPIPRPDTDDPWRKRLVHVSGRLAAVDGRYTDWAAEAGVPVGSVADQGMKDDLIAELDALVALLYGLNRGDLQHVFATFHRGWNYEPRLTAALAHYDRWTEEGGSGR
jgi:hypothetical protein